MNIHLTKKGYKNRNTARASACRYVKKHGLINSHNIYTVVDNRIYVEITDTVEVEIVDKPLNQHGIETEVDYIEVLKPIITFINTFNSTPQVPDIERFAIEEYFTNNTEQLVETIEALKKLIPDWNDSKNIMSSEGDPEYIEEFDTVINDDDVYETIYTNNLKNNGQSMISNGVKHDEYMIGLETIKIDKILEINCEL